MIDYMEIAHLISSMEHTLEPTWANDTGRNSNNGDFSGTFIGYFDQIVINFTPTSAAEIKDLREKFEHPIVSFKFRDSRTNSDRIGDFYGTSIKASFDNLEGKYKSTSITLTAVKKRSDM